MVVRMASQKAVLRALTMVAEMVALLVLLKAAGTVRRWVVMMVAL